MRTGETNFYYYLPTKSEVSAHPRSYGRRTIPTLGVRHSRAVCFGADHTLRLDAFRRALGCEEVDVRTRGGLVIIRSAGSDGLRGKIIKKITSYLLIGARRRGAAGT